MSSMHQYINELIQSNMATVIHYRDVEGEEITVQGHILRLSEVSGREIIETDAGLIIGVDQIISLNNRRS